MAANGGKFGKLEGKPGMGGIPPRQTLPSMPPVIRSSEKASSGGGMDSQLALASNVPRPGSKQVIQMLRDRRRRTTGGNMTVNGDVIDAAGH